MTARSTGRSRLQSSSEEPLVGNYYVAVYPPFSCWEVAHIPALERALHQPSAGAPLGLYVHVPFCHRKCDYCYYLSYVGQTADVVDRYLETVINELSIYAQRPAVAGRPVAFVYFGGGTPSLLTSSQVRRLGDGLQSALPWDAVEEVTFECAPRSVRPDFLEALREIGVTRLSMGVQSFDNTLLKMNGRIHLAEDVLRAYSLIEQAGFGSVNLDLMAGLMGETGEQWKDAIRRVIELGPDSVTIYQTEIPYNTQLYRDLKSGCLPAAPASWKVKRARLDYAFAELDRAGYTVTSAYTAVKDPSRHRFFYQDYLWGGADMLGLGVASFGYLRGVHFQNEVTLEGYETEVARGVLPLKRAYQLSGRDQLVREFVLQLKTGQVLTETFRHKFGVDVTLLLAEPLQALAAKNLLVVSPTAVRLTGSGLLQVDRLLPHFYDPQFKNLRYT